jgi:hypothetical protein
MLGVPVLSPWKLLVETKCVEKLQQRDKDREVLSATGLKQCQGVLWII